MSEEEREGAECSEAILSRWDEEWDWYELREDVMERSEDYRVEERSKEMMMVVENIGEERIKENKMWKNMRGKVVSRGVRGEEGMGGEGN